MVKDCQRMWGARTRKRHTTVSQDTVLLDINTFLLYFSSIFKSKYISFPTGKVELKSEI